MNKRNTILVFTVSVILSLGLTAFNIMAPDGAPVAKTGSPGDGSTCTSCHGGTAQNVSGWITTDIPAEGYTPGQTYQVTCTNNLSGNGKYGFQCSPQNIAGALLGTMTAGTNNKLVGSGKYVTHTQANTTNSSWTFSWTAPAANVGTVTFYAAFAKGPAGNVAKTSLTVTKASGMGIDHVEMAPKLSVTPNPNYGKFEVKNVPGKVDGIKIYGPAGNLVYQKQQPETNSSSLDIDLGKPSPGVYFMSIQMGNERIVRKVVIR